MARPARDVWFLLLLLLGVFNAGNGVWMLLDAAGWFGRVAADVVPYNVHLVRDVGAAYVVAGVALVWAAFRAEWRVPLVAMSAAFQVLHALGHVRETWSGELHASHWLADLPSVYLPAILMLVLLTRFVRHPPAD